MPFFRVVLRRSAIGLHRRKGRILDALGFRRRADTVHHEITPKVAGMIFKVKELVEVHKVEERKTRAQVRLERKPDPGYAVLRGTSQG